MKIDKEKYLQQLIKLKGDDDPEVAHSEADGILLVILTKLGYTDIVNAYCEIER